jgi:hypothetical protein
MGKTALVLAALLLLALPASALAEGYLGLYGGNTFLRNTNIEACNGQVLMTDARFDTGTAVGGKGGFWLNRFPWVAVEVNAWNTWSRLQGDDLNFVNVSGSLLLQWVESPVRIYAGGGAVATFDGTVSWGPLAQAGLEVTIVRHWAVFGEWRFSKNTFVVEDYDTRLHLRRNEALGGVNYHF